MIRIGIDALGGDASQISALINGLEGEITSSGLISLLMNPGQSANTLLFESLRYPQYNPSMDLVGGAQFLNTDSQGFVTSTSYAEYSEKMANYYKDMWAQDEEQVIQTLTDALNTAFEDGKEDTNYKMLSKHYNY